MQHFIKVSMLILVAITILGCAGPTVDPHPIETRVAASIFATLTAAAPTASSTPVATTAPSTPAFGKWNVETKVSPIDDSKSVILSLTADNEVTGKYQTSTPVLLLRCQKSKLEIYVSTGMQTETISGYNNTLSDVKMRFDADPAIELWANESEDMTTLFLGHPQPRDVLPWFLAHNKMIFEFTPYQMGLAADAVFDLRGLPAANKPVNHVCPLSSS
jgi:type VI secretion system protein VasI